MPFINGCISTTPRSHRTSEKKTGMLGTSQPLQYWFSFTMFPKHHQCHEVQSQQGDHTNGLPPKPSTISSFFSPMPAPSPLSLLSGCLCRGCLDLCWFVPSLSFQFCAVILFVCHQTFHLTPSLRKLWFLLLLNLKLNYSDYFLQWWEFSQPSHSTCLWLVRKQITCINAHS